MNRAQSSQLVGTVPVDKSSMMETEPSSLEQTTSKDTVPQMSAVQVDPAHGLVDPQDPHFNPDFDEEPENKVQEHDAKRV